MAVSPGLHLRSTDGLHVRPPAVRHFVRLKVRMIGNGMRGRPRRIVLFLVGLIAGIWFGAGGFVLFKAGSSAGDAGVAVTAVGLGGAALTVGWLLVPLLFFGVDETIDPARFALLPVPRRTLAAGMLAAACVGVPALATLAAGLGLAAGGLSAGPAVAAVGVASAVLGLLVCVVGSRVVTSAFASMLRSRRTRDLAAMVMVLLATSIGPAQVAISSLVTRSGLAPLTRAARVLAWTPLAAHYAAVLDAREGHWAMVAARFGVVLVAVALALWWWSLTLESAMLGGGSAGPAGRLAEGTGLAAGLVPRPLRRLPAGPFTAIMSRDLRYYWRDPRWRSGVASLVMSSLFLPVMLVVVPGRSGTSMVSPVVVAVFIGVLTGIFLANIFGNDGLAYASQLLVGVPGRVELRARAATLAMLVVPLLAAVLVGVALFQHRPQQAAATFGIGLAAFGSSVGAALVTAVFSPYPMPPTGNPFAVSSGGATLRGLLVLVGTAAATGITGPVIVLYLLLPQALRWLVLPVGAAWCLGAVLISSYIVGDALDRRGPEVLTAVTPRH